MPVFILPDGYNICDEKNHDELLDITIVFPESMPIVGQIFNKNLQIKITKLLVLFQIMISFIS